jgi:hypothetical protein
MDSISGLRYLPSPKGNAASADGVEALAETWIVRQWWPAEARPTGDGYYTYAPS